MNDTKILCKRKPHPQEKTNFLSDLFFCWTYPVFYRGLKKEMTEEDLFSPLKKHESSFISDKLEKAWNDELKKSKRPSLIKAMIKVFGVEILFLALTMFFFDFVIKLIQPIFLGKLMTYYDTTTPSSKNQAYVSAAWIVIGSFLNMFLGHFLMLRNLTLGMRVKIACSSLIYRKSLRLSRSALANCTTGQIINLLANDVRRFNHVFVDFFAFWSAPIQITIIACLLYFSVSPIALSGIGLLLAYLLLQIYYSTLISRIRARTSIKTDNRVRLMNEIISGIQVIKMYTWEKPFSKLVELARKVEIQQLQNLYNLNVTQGAISVFVNRTAVFLCILIYVLLGNRLNAYYVFVVTSFYNIIKQSLTRHLRKAIRTVAEARVSATRIETFLLQDEMCNDALTQKSDSAYVRIQNGSAKWDKKDSTEYSLEKINFTASVGELIAVIGPVGCGKSSLLQVILKELPLIEGSIDVNGRISYASQEAWLFGSSIRQNILFGQSWDEKKYDEVIRVCALDRDFSLFPCGDLSIVGERGVLLSGGQKARVNLARAVYKDADIYLLDDPLSAVDTHVGKQLFDNCISQYLGNKCVILVTHQLQYLSAVDRMYLIENGCVSLSGSFDEVKQSSNEFIKLLQKQDTHEDVHEEEVKKEPLENGINKNKNKEAPKEQKEHQELGKVRNKVYAGYFNSGGKWLFYIPIFLYGVIQACSSYADYFLAFWVNLEEERVQTNSTVNEFLTSENCIYIYSGLTVIVVVLMLVASNTFMRSCMRASRNLHNKMFNNIVYTTMRFFHTNPSGRILNRFSKDMGSIDEGLPETLLGVMQMALQLLAVIIVVVSVNPWIIIPTVVIIIIFYLLRKVFLATSRSVKRLEGITRSPVFSHLATSLNGLTTIRAFAAEDVLKKEFDAHQNLNSSAFYLFISTNRAFGFILDFHCTIYLAFVTVSFLFLNEETAGGTVGLAITQSTVLMGMCQFGIRQWSELVNQMTSVERVLEYTEIAKEENNQKNPPQNWPIMGSINFKALFLRYSPTDPYVLRNLNFTIKSGEKIGIVGRTGAGKSSLISALFRLAPIEGLIQIDDVDITAISLESLRSKISIIPQEPILFSGTLRRNLDPFDIYKDAELWSALEEVELRGMVAELGAGLDTNLSEGGSNFSVGQRQLVCLARAILRDNKILVLDEATANVDPQTDALIQATIRRKFKDCTVLTIAHRLHTIMDSDRVLVMEVGEVVEFDLAYKLLQNANGVFYNLVQQTGRGTAEHLLQMAKENFDKKKRN